MKRPLGKPMRISEDNIKMVLKEMALEGVHWVDLAEHRVRWRDLVNTVMNLRVPFNAGFFLHAECGI
jgi:hypothetical protein